MGDCVRMIPSTSYKSLRYVNMNNEDVNQGGLITIIHHNLPKHLRASSQEIEE